MKRKKVWRYWCDYCGKGMCSKISMELHEKHCTMNPQRHCRMCDLDEDLVQQGTSVLIAAYDDSIDRLREVAGGCPACMLTGIRQWKKAHPEADRWDDWDFKKEVDIFWVTSN